MLKNIVLITIENFNREYNGKNLLSRELVKKGFIVFLGHKSIIRLIAKFLKLKNCIFIDKGNRKGSLIRLKKIFKNGQKIYLFDEEGLMQTDFLNFLERNHEASSIKLIDGVFSWGPKHSKLLKKAGYKEDQIIKSGNPRFDPYLIKKEIHSKKENRKTILICSRFASANPNKKIKDDIDKRDSSEEYLDGCRRVLEIMLKIPYYLRTSGIKNPILIRPHPSESPEIWQRSIIDLKDVKVEFKGPINALFPNAMILIHNRCTTSIEAFLSQVPIISFEPIILKSPPQPDINLFDTFSNYKCSNLKQLIKPINEIQDKEYNFDFNQKANTYIYISKDISSAKIADYLNKKSKRIILFKILIYFMEILFLLPFIISRNTALKTLNRFKNYNDYKYKIQKNGVPPKSKIFTIEKNCFTFNLIGKIKLYLPRFV